jgi:hypothetical protein
MADYTLFMVQRRTLGSMTFSSSTYYQKGVSAGRARTDQPAQHLVILRNILLVTYLQYAAPSLEMDDAKSRHSEAKLSRNNYTT